MARPRLRIISDGTDRATQVQYAEHDEWTDISGVVSEITWHLKAGEPAEASIHIPFPALQAAAENTQVIINEFLPSIAEYPLRCKDCGWIGRVDGAIPDIDDDGGVGCPECGRLLDSRVP